MIRLMLTLMYSKRMKMKKITIMKRIRIMKVVFQLKLMTTNLMMVRMKVSTFKIIRARSVINSPTSTMITAKTTCRKNSSVSSHYPCAHRSKTKGKR